MLTLDIYDVNITKVLLLPVTLEDVKLSYEKVMQAKNFIVGTKQTVKALRNGNVKEVLVAMDAAPMVTAEVINTAEELNIPITYVDSMKSLGKACSIEVGAATVALTH